MCLFVNTADVLNMKTRSQRENKSINKQFPSARARSHTHTDRACMYIVSLTALPFSRLLHSHSDLCVLPSSLHEEDISSVRSVSNVVTTSHAGPTTAELVRPQHAHESEARVELGIKRRTLNIASARAATRGGLHPGLVVIYN